MPQFELNDTDVQRIITSKLTDFFSILDNTRLKEGDDIMTTIFKAVPGQPEVNISYLDDSIRFIGNDVKTINIERVQYGKTLIIDEADSLREINIRNSGATISFNEFPKQTIRIRGAFE